MSNAAFVFFVTFVSFVFFVNLDARERQAPDCTTAPQCREMTLAAIAAQDFERAHDLAWRVYQTSPRGSADAMALLARAQSLSGRGDDAFVMLQRVSAAGGRVADLETSDDFRRVREHPRWQQLRAAMAPTSAPGAQDAVNSLASPDAPAAPEAPEAPDAPSAPEAPDAPSAPEAPEAPDAPGLPLPSSLPTPGVFAYDAVSARFILADHATDALRVVSESSGNATTLVSAGWSGYARITGVAINRQNGDMWVTARGDDTSALHRFQLVSGRLLQTFGSPEDAGAVQLAAVAVASDAVYVLDDAGRRLFVWTAGNKMLREFAELPDTIVPLGLTRTGTALLVTHTGGVIRVDLGSRATRPVTAPQSVDVSGLHSPAWHQGALLAVQEHPSGARVVRVRFNARGTAATTIDVLYRSAGTAAALAGDAYYFLTDSPDTGLAFRSLPIAK